MGNTIRGGRLEVAQYDENFADLHPPLSDTRAKAEAQKCLFCYGAPCMEACPTSIDIPLFIRQIATANPAGAAQTIFDSNILGGMCARVCPTETLCEEVCVHVNDGNDPVKIGQLQRYASDHAMTAGTARFEKAAPSGRKVAIVGAGPAGLACAHALALKGHEVTIYEAREKPGGLNEFGLAAYKTTGNFAQQEIDFVLSVGGIAIENGKRLGADISIADLSRDYDAVFLAMGLGGVNELGIEGEELSGVIDAVGYIADLRQSPDLATLAVGDRVVVIGGGMTAIDIAVQTKKLGAREVCIAYRRGPEQMGASPFERELAQTSGVTIINWAAPTKINGKAAAESITFARTALNADGKLRQSEDTFTLAADQVFKAIGQKLDPTGLTDTGIDMSRGKIVVDVNRKTTRDSVWAGGDCVADGDDLTVSAVEDGKVAAAAIDAALKGA